MNNMFNFGGSSAAPSAPPAAAPSPPSRSAWETLKCKVSGISSSTRSKLAWALGLGVVGTAAWYGAHTHTAHVAKRKVESYFVTSPIDNATSSTPPPRPSGDIAANNASRLAGAAAHDLANASWEAIRLYRVAHPTATETEIKAALPAVYADLRRHSEEALAQWTVALQKPNTTQWSVFIEGQPDQFRYNGFSASWGYNIAHDIYRGRNNRNEAAMVFHNTMALPGICTSNQLCTVPGRAATADQPEVPAAPGLLAHAHAQGFARFDIARPSTLVDGVTYLAVPGASLADYPPTAVFTTNELRAFRMLCPQEPETVLPPLATLVPVQN